VQWALLCIAYFFCLLGSMKGEKKNEEQNFIPSALCIYAGCNKPLKHICGRR